MSLITPRSSAPSMPPSWPPAASTCVANAGIDSGPGFVSGWSGSQRARNPDGALENYSDEAEPRHRRKSERRIRNAPDRGPPHEAAAFRTAHRDDSVRGLSVRAGRRLGLHGGEGRVRAPDALRRARAGRFQYHGSTQLHGVLCHQHRRRTCEEPGGAGAIAKLYADAAASVFPDDIKGLALFLASPASAYLTGQQITNDGGWNARHRD